jgi:flagellar protein FliJ
MASRSTSVIKMLKEIAAKEVDVAAEALAQTMKSADEAQSKHRMLLEYQQDYIKNLNNLMEAGIGAEAYRNFQNFFNKLNQAVLGQLEVVEFTKRQVQVQRELWQECQRKKLSYEVLADRSDKRAVKVEQKMDQKLMDEFSVRATHGKHSKSGIINSRS